MNENYKASIAAKIMIDGTIELLTPLLIGTGSQNEHDTSAVDSPVLRDNKGVPFIPGTSLTGVIREYVDSLDHDMTLDLFGTDSEAENIEKNAHDKLQSAVMLSDILLKNYNVSVRDGIAIDGIRNTTIKAKKYDFQVVERGAYGRFHMEITLRKYHIDKYAHKFDKFEKFTKMIAAKLSAGFHVGADTTKGLGKVAVRNLTVNIYDFSDVKNVLNWLHPDGRQDAVVSFSVDKAKPDIPKDDFVLDADFAISHSLIIRDYDEMALEKANRDAGNSDNSIKSIMRKSGNEYLIPGSSIKGVLRHRSEYILDTIGKDYSILDKLMGYADSAENDNKKLRSRLYVEEVYISPDSVKCEVQSRNRIDRITGGTVDGALFTSQPIWQNNDTPSVHVHLEIKKAKKHEIGLMICLLKDIWLERVAIGGEKSIGRGVLKGLSATLNYGADGLMVKLNNGTAISEKNAELMKKYISALMEHV